MVRQPDISIKDILNYQNNYRNTFVWLVSLSYNAANLIISLVCRWWVFQNLVTYALYINHTIDAAEILEPSEETMEHIVEGQNATLTCIGIGHPPPLVQWKRLNRSLSDRVSITNMSMSTNEGNVTRVSVDLILTGVSREDTGVYVCSAANLLIIATRNVSLIVQCMIGFIYL